METLEDVEALNNSDEKGSLFDFLSVVEGADNKSCFGMPCILISKAP
jgi:hypothetical protein